MTIWLPEIVPVNSTTKFLAALVKLSVVEVESPSVINKAVVWTPPAIDCEWYPDAACWIMFKFVLGFVPHVPAF